MAIESCKAFKIFSYYWIFGKFKNFLQLLLIIESFAINYKLNKIDLIFNNGS